jgi:hypothetical protein
MKAFVASVIAVVVISVAAGFILNSQDHSTAEAYHSSATRL